MKNLRLTRESDQRKREKSQNNAATNGGWDHEQGLASVERAIINESESREPWNQIEGRWLSRERRREEKRWTYLLKETREGKAKSDSWLMSEYAEIRVWERKRERESELGERESEEK